MRIEKIMTCDVISVAPEMSLKDVARLLVAHRISGVPVCGPNGEVLGVVSEADILRKEEGVSTDLARPLAWLARKLDGELDKISARTAGEAMTTPALTVRPTQHVSDVARLMVDYTINRVPVVAGGRLVGIVGRADLVRAFIRTDAEIESEIRKEVLLEIMLLAPGEVEFTVENGRVVMSGHLNTREDAELLERYVRRVPGVLEVVSDLRWSRREARARHVESGWA
jgi:CBS domain-containing protein